MIVPLFPYVVMPLLCSYATIMEQRTEQTEQNFLNYYTTQKVLHSMDSLIRIKIYYNSDNFNESTSSILGPQKRYMNCISNRQPSLQ